MMKNGPSHIRIEQTNTLPSSELDEEIRVRIAVEGRVSWCETEPDAGAVDVAFACLKHEVGGGHVET